MLLHDSDGDGFLADEDCNDGDSGIHPETEEICDGIDNNCNGFFDEGELVVIFADGDNDGFGNPNIGTEACEAPSGFVENNTDCNDGSDSAHPDREELCDGLDNNCDGEIDENVMLEFFVDSDNDGSGNVYGGSGASWDLSQVYIR